MVRALYTLRIPSSTRYLETVRRFVEQHARKAGLPETVINELKLAVDEACTNIIKHAYKGRTDQPIDVAVLIEPERFVVRLRDQGDAFDVTHYREPDLQALIRRRQGGGLGIRLIRKLMDQVEYRSLGRYNEVQLVKYLHPAPAPNTSPPSSTNT
ncbi:ATP-binding protein [Rhodothermus bifroesti]|uniref:ATP-binding protein n=1 Tax=Rhodothermus marinus TaxID=29549 RepID=A0A7V2B0A4_RHOMR|nr:Serine-protein kinase RsbW [bacterium HR18]